jgi:hypothetical protein
VHPYLKALGKGFLDYKGFVLWASERSAAVKKQSGINGLLPALRAAESRPASE